MSEASKPFILPVDRAPALPLSKRTRDMALPVVVFLSLIVHATVLVPLLFQGKTVEAAAPAEIPVEVIQEAPKPQPPDSQPPKSDPAKSDPAKSEPSKSKSAKSEPAKSEHAKPEPPKPEPPKPPPPKEAAKPPAPQPKPVAKQEPSKPEPNKQEPSEQAKQARVAERMKDLLGQTPSLDPIVLPGESANGTEGASYPQLVMSKLTKALSFERHSQGKVGSAVVTFVLDDVGDVASVTLDRSSGDQALDTEIVAVIKRGAPYPAPPPGGKRDYTVTMVSRPVL